MIPKLLFPILFLGLLINYALGVVELSWLILIPYKLLELCFIILLVKRNEMKEKVRVEQECDPLHIRSLSAAELTRIQGAIEEGLSELYLAFERFHYVFFGLAVVMFYEIAQEPTSAKTFWGFATVFLECGVYTIQRGARKRLLNYLKQRAKDINNS